MLAMLAFMLSIICWNGSIVGSYSTSSPNSRATVIVAGNFSINGITTNVAEYDIITGSWSTKRQSELFLYGENNGVIWDIAVNHTSNPYDTMYIVGTFDTDSKASQMQFCSISEFDGVEFNKVGEGLCPRGEDTSEAMQLYASVLGNNGDLYVGGSFESRVWNGIHFANVYDVARYDARSMTWLPLTEGQFLCTDGSAARVSTLAWDAEMSILYIGGSFQSVDNTSISAGLAMWSKRTGLIDFPGGGVLHSDSGGGNTQVKAIAYEPKSESLFITGLFRQVGDKTCNGVAVWTRWSNLWRCLADDAHAISVGTAMLLTPTHLYVTGWAAASSTWSQQQQQQVGDAFPYAVARMEVFGFIQENDARDYSLGLLDLAAAHPREGKRSSVAVGRRARILRETQQTIRTASHNSSTSSSRLYSNTRRPEDRPCLTEEGVTVCGERPAVLGQVHKSMNVRHLRHKTTTHNLQHAPVLPVSSPLGHSTPTDVNNSTSQLVLSRRGEHSQRRLDLLDWGVLNKHKHKHRRSHDKNIKERSTVNGTSQEPASPPSSRAPWSPVWAWLPGFQGTNGPIFRMTEGRDRLANTILIGGAFSNYPAIVVWSADPTGISGPPSVTHIPGSNTLAGLITSIVQANVPEETTPVPPSPTPAPAPSIRTDYAFLVVAGGVGMGIVMGLVLAIGCCTRQGFQFVSLPSNLGGKPEDGFGGGLSLTTLSGGTPGALADFRICFERAMAARHLPTHETLLVINPQEIVLSRIIGEGSFGRVWNGHWRNNAVAVKEFVFAQAAIEGGSLQRSSIIEEIVGEAGIMACLRHPKILQLYGCSLTMQAIWIVSELCVNGSLRMVLSNKVNNLSLLTKLTLCMDIADGMHYLHSRTPPIIHRDLKSLNIFITEVSPGGLVAKIGDWGSARAVALTGQKSMTQGVGTACWLSPEVINHAHFSKHSDVYAFGIILWEVFTRQDVYSGLSAAQIIAKVAHEGLRPQVPPDCPWESVMTACWKLDPYDRPNFYTVLLELSKIHADLKTRALQNITLEDGVAVESDESDSLIPSVDPTLTADMTAKSSVGWQPSAQSQQLMLQTLVPPPPPGLSSLLPPHPVKSALRIQSDIPSGVTVLTPSPSTYPTPRTAQPYNPSMVSQSSGNSSPHTDNTSPNGSAGNMYRNELPLNFDVSDLTGPTYYIMDEEADADDADPLDFLFSNHARGNNNRPPTSVPPPQPQHDVYVGDKALKPYTARRGSGNKQRPLK